MKKSLIFALIIISLLSFAFYWYEWRPSQFKAECHTYAVKKAIADSGNPKGKTFADDDYHFRYDYCLRSKGLK
jgi:hypothetical protein